MNQPAAQITAPAPEQESLALSDTGIVRLRNYDELFRYAQDLAASEMVPKDYRNKPENALVAIQLGAELGIKPLQAIQNIAVINGRPSIWGDLALAICRAHPQWGGIEETMAGDEAICTVTRIERTAAGPIKSVVSRTFSMEDAKRAGLASKDGPWKQYPKRMLAMRARAFALRDSFTDALKGIALREEQQDVIDVVANDVTPQAAEAPKSGVAGLRERLAAKKPEAAKAPADPEPPQSTVVPESADVWVAAYGDAKVMNDIPAIKRDLKAVWDAMPREVQAAIKRAEVAATKRLESESKA